jgi:NADH-quinone oxidoreductase subunit N
MGSITSQMFLSILPEILLLVLILVILISELFIKPEDRRTLGWVTATGIVLIMILSLIFARPPAGEQAQLLWGGMIRWDMMGFTFAMLFLFAAAMTALLGMDIEGLGNRGEFYILLLASTIGMVFLGYAADLIMLYLALETIAIPLYVLAGFVGATSDRSIEAGFKYLLFGAMASAVMLYGLSLLYGLTSTTELYSIVQTFLSGQIPLWPIIGSLVLILVGFGFKISAVPLHFWAPDVYEGAPTPVTGFLSTASKAAGFLVLMRVLFVVFPVIMQSDGQVIEANQIWGGLIAAISVATMTLGNLLALAQKNIKRMLAYSSIAHAGYALIGIASLSGLGLTSTIYYLIAYMMTNLAAFGAVSAYSQIIGSDEIKDFAGMSRRAPGLALIMLVAFLSLSGMPPFAGFIAKFLVFASAVQSYASTGQFYLLFLAIVGILNSIVGLYYYLNVLKVIYLYRSEDENKPAPVPAGMYLALGVLVMGVLIVGIIVAPWFSWSYTAAAGLF